MMAEATPRVLGLDLSLTSTGMVVLPANWVPGTWDIPSETIGYALRRDSTLLEQVNRLVLITDCVSAFAVVHRATHVFIEDHAYGMSALGGIRLAELHGSVKVELAKRGLVSTPVAQTTVRKFLLGKLPRGGRGAVPAAVHQALKALGCPWEGSDRGDALVVANYGRTELGLPGLSVAT